MYTILGGSGFIGSELVLELRRRKLNVFVPSKDDTSLFERPLGNVIYCIGVTSDYRQRHFDTIEAHVSYLNSLLHQSDFDSFLYLSSTRLYKNSIYTKEESSINVFPNEPDELYNISKVMGESICLSSQNKNVKVARLSNVCGNNFESSNFLYALCKETIKNKNIFLKDSLESERDYIMIENVIESLLMIATQGQHRIYNVASGYNLKNAQVAELLKEITGYPIMVSQHAQTIKFPLISVERIKEEFDISSHSILHCYNKLIKNFISQQGS